MWSSTDSLKTVFRFHISFFVDVFVYYFADKMHSHISKQEMHLLVMFLNVIGHEHKERLRADFLL